MRPSSPFIKVSVSPHDALLATEKIFFALVVDKLSCKGVPCRSRKAALS